MKIKSLRLHDGSQPLSELFQISGAIRSVIVISAYIDLVSIDQLIEFVLNGADSRGYPHIRIFIDKSSSRFCSDRETQKRFLESEGKIRAFCDSKSGIFLVQLGALFHSKAYLIEGNKKGKILFGSMNLTQNGINGNEELLLFEDIIIGQKTNANRLSAWIKKYSEELHEKSIKVGSNTQERFPACIRQLLLDGSIYYELKEQNPFRFKLSLPEEIVKQQATVDQLLEANVTDSVSIEALIRTSSPVGLGIELPRLGGTRALWKKFCIETCYGYWNPDYLRDELRATLKRRSIERKPHFDEIKRIMNERESELGTCFLGLCFRIQSHLKSVGVLDWKYAEERIADEAWAKFIENIKSKIENNDKYYDRLVSGISNVPAPDVWSDPLSSEEFENTFCESLMYHWSKEYSKETMNVVAQAFAWNLGLDAVNKEEIDSKQLRNLIDKWLAGNPAANIACFNEK